MTNFFLPIAGQFTNCRDREQRSLHIGFNHFAVVALGFDSHHLSH